MKPTRSRLAWAALSVAAHVGVLVALLSVGPEPLRPAPEPPAMPVELVAPRLVPPPQPPTPPTPEPQPAPPQPAAPTPPRPTLKVRKPAPAPPAVTPLAVVPGPVTTPGDEVSEAEIASAAVAGSGAGGPSGCDMARWLQGRLRGDRQVQAAAAAVHRGKAILVWNGDWVPHPGQEGAGLAAVREAIMWEVAFAPVACRAEPVHGLVLLSLADGPAAPRLVVGSPAWRWSDLLFARSRGQQAR